ncbi:unnamed protein product [Closterium sp. NIES-54]
MELLLHEAHDGITSGHFGVEKTRQQLHRYYYWPELLTDLQHHVGSCHTCQVMKSSRKRKAGQLQPIPPPERAWQQVTMDFVTGLPSNPGGDDAVMFVVDRLTKMAHFVACKKSISAEETARLFIATVVRLHGILAAIISDRDTKFTSNFWKNRWEQFGTMLQFSSSYHPETDDQTERTNQTMEQLIRATCDDPTTWEQQLPLIEFAYNNATSATTQPSPFYLNYGQNPTVPMTPSPDNPTPRAHQFVEILQAARTRAAEAIKKSNVIAKRNVDRHRRPVSHVPVRGLRTARHTELKTARRTKITTALLWTISNQPHDHPSYRPLTVADRLVHQPIIPRQPASPLHPKHEPTASSPPAIHDSPCIETDHRPRKKSEPSDSPPHRQQEDRVPRSLEGPHAN